MKTIKAFFHRFNPLEENVYRTVFSAGQDVEKEKQEIKM